MQELNYKNILTLFIASLFIISLFNDGWQRQSKIRVSQGMSYKSATLINGTWVNHKIKLGYPCEWYIEQETNGVITNYATNFRQMTIKGYLGRSSIDGKFWCYS